MGGRHRASGSPPQRTLLAVGAAVLVVASSGGLVAVIGTDGSNRAARPAVVDSALPGKPRLVRSSHAPSVSSWDGGFFKPPSDDDLRRVSTPPESRPVATTAPPAQSRPPQARSTRPVPSFSRSCYVFRDRDGRTWRYCPRDR
ncbi:MAG: hypothetical protein GEV10_31040 [Streptosporangiales bacterium]|nr:hypothetical protein [Streptosporangiales bacterium]